MFKVFTRKTSAAVVSLALGTALVAVPAANAETPDSATEVNKVDVSLPLACNLKLKSKLKLVDGVYDVSEYPDFQIQVEAQAPKSVQPGEEFDYVISPATLSIPGEITKNVLIPVTATVNWVKQLNVWIDLPATAEVKEVVHNGDPDKISVTAEDGRLHIKGTDGANVKDWTVEGMDAQWEPGGLEAEKDGDKFVVHTPKIVLKMKATGNVGDKIALKIRDTNATSFSSELFTQMYAEATALSTKKAAFIRCGLSEYDEGHLGQNPSTPFPAVEIKEVTPEAVDVTAKVKLLDEEGNPFKEGETVQLLVNGNPVKFTVEADGFITITDTKMPDDEQKAVEVAFEGGEPVSVKLNTTEDAPQAEATTLQKQKKPEPQPKPEPEDKGSSADEAAQLVFSSPKIWGSILGVLVGLPLIGFLFQIIIDFFGHTRF